MTDAQALGQLIMGRFVGRRPPAAVLGRIRRGELGGVILFRDNLRGGRPAVRAMIARLQRAAADGGNPPLLIAIDQEGGAIRRIAGPPQPSASRMRSVASAQREGERTGRFLAGLGVNLDLAPVADRAQVPDSFLRERSFGRAPADVARRACAFSAGLRTHGVLATLKHFPGLGAARVSTDAAPASIGRPAAGLRRDYAPYARCGKRVGTLVMMSSAVYPELLGSEPAVLSPAAYRRELQGVAGQPITISDDLETPAIAGLQAPARRAILAGLDILLYAKTEAGSQAAYPRLLADVRVRRLRIGRIRSSARRIAVIKQFAARG